MALKAAARKRLRSASFALPSEKKYPVTNPGEAHAALSYGARFASPAQYAKIRNKVASQSKAHGWGIKVSGKKGGK